MNMTWVCILVTDLDWSTKLAQCPVVLPVSQLLGVVIRAWFDEILSWNGSCEPKQSKFAAVALQCLVKVRYLQIASWIHCKVHPHFSARNRVHDWQTFAALIKIIKTVETLMPLSRPRQCWKTSLKCGRVWYVQWPLEKRYLWITI